MATCDYPRPHSASEDYERDKLGSLRFQLERANQDKARLEAAIAFLEANPGAIALINSI